MHYAHQYGQVINSERVSVLHRRHLVQLLSTPRPLSTLTVVRNRTHKLNIADSMFPEMVIFMMNIVSATLDRLPPGLDSLTAAYRYKVFVEHLGWQLVTQDGMERDQFDRSYTVYLVARNKVGEVCGCARLLPTTRPYLLSEIFPQLLNGAPSPSTPEVWELSRFAAFDFNANRAVQFGQFSSPVAIALLNDALGYAASRGAKRLITVSPIGIERLLRRAGFRAYRAGPPIIFDGRPIFACWIEISRSQIDVTADDVTSVLPYN